MRDAMQEPPEPERMKTPTQAQPGTETTTLVTDYNSPETGWAGPRCNQADAPNCPGQTAKPAELCGMDGAHTVPWPLPTQPTR